MAASSQSQDKLTSGRGREEELEVLENGGLSPQPSVRTDEDACSEIVRIEQQDDQEEKYRNTTMGRFVRSLQVRCCCCRMIGWLRGGGRERDGGDRGGRRRGGEREREREREREILFIFLFFYSVYVDGACWVCFCCRHSPV